MNKLLRFMLGVAGVAHKVAFCFGRRMLLQAELMEKM
jgi:hypothetical protein